MESATGTPAEQPASRRAAYRDVPKRKLTYLLLKDTYRSCVEYRVVGMSAEAAFFTMLSLPALLLGLVGLVGAVDSVAGTTVLHTVRRRILDASALLLSERGVDELVTPLVDDLVSGARPAVLSFGFVFALWSGSRAMNVFIGTITVMYGLDGYRNPVATRLLAFGLCAAGLVVGALVVPMTLIGPRLAVARWPELSGLIAVVYWPLVLLLAVSFLATLYHVSVPVRSPWREDVPGALVCLLLWTLCAVALKAYLRGAVEGQSIYGSLAAPVAVLLWLGMSAFAVLVGAAVNAAVDRVWPAATTAAARARNERAREDAARAMVAAVVERRSRAETAGLDAEQDARDFELTRRLRHLMDTPEVRDQLDRLRDTTRRIGRRMTE
ncbi:YihY/virulence factor BrkB family protein [Streptomyces alkaliterrae]|uniref:YihY/virulence factor BrkB family protein n=2 Tax=Streptomyces alkaliterrae TaxID=2213162 RepID=A0A7W3ZN63_9ACTN|nr:YhjD/YihY/BrkB family envelope integrity protein [Streptomyces alkaliterrae]MBB1254097.1 YihY/virulence factor BrkB family protein [Streptomyces alkaliterrae]MBB1258745.1 YihY/virulence factor BrkB family protein [Streptomyces alkaliterrae]